MRRRLSYANVMATLAFFFALTGGSMAAAKYLQASDSITQGDLAGSTYGSPTIAAGKITTSKFDSAAVAPNADKLDGKDSSELLSVVARGVRTTPPVSISVDPGTCLGAFQEVPPGLNTATDFAIVQQPSSLREVFYIDSSTDVQGGIPVLNIYICNNSPLAQIVPASTNLNWIVVR